MNKKILVVEDDKDYAKLVETALVQAGYAVVVLNEDGTLFEKMKLEQPNLILLDIMLPHVSGLSLLESLKGDSKTKDIAVFCLTNLPDETGREKALSLGAHSYLTKVDYTLSDIVKYVDVYFKEEAPKSV